MTEVTAVRTIDTITGEIKALQRSTLGYIIEIGRRICEAKDMLPHGEFGEWLEKEVDFSTSTANNFMRIFEEYGSPQSSLFGAEPKSQALGNLSYTKALKLIAVPDGERAEFAKANDIEHKSTRELDELIKERDAALKLKAKAEEDLRKADEGNAKALGEFQGKVDLLREAAKKKDDRIRELSEQIDAMKAEPIDITVTPEPDPEKLTEAIEKAKAEAVAEKQKEIEKLEKELKATTKEKAGIVTAKEAAEKAKQEALNALNEETKKAELATQQAEALRKAQAMNDTTVTEFKALFNEAQRMLGRLKELAQSAAGENKEKLEEALDAMLNAYKTGASE